MKVLTRLILVVLSISLLPFTSQACTPPPPPTPTPTLTFTPTSTLTSTLTFTPTTTPTPTLSPTPTLTFTPTLTTTPNLADIPGSILYVNLTEGGMLLSLINAAGESQVYTNIGFIIPYYPKVFNNGSTLIFLAYSYEQVEENFATMEFLKGNTLRYITQGGIITNAYSISPDGSTIAYEDDSKHADIVLVDVQTGKKKNFPGNSPARDEYPVFSPDGKRLAFVSDRLIGDNALDKIFVANLDGSNPINLTPDSRSMENYGPAWSPDGSQIAFFHYSAFGLSNEFTSGLYIVPADGGTPDLVVKVDGIFFDPQAPVWSPDGNYLAYKVDRKDGTSEIWIASITSGTAIRIPTKNTETYTLTWSPDSRVLIFDTMDIDNYTANLYFVWRDGSGLRPLLSCDTCLFPTWIINP